MPVGEDVCLDGDGFPNHALDGRAAGVDFRLYAQDDHSTVTVVRFHQLGDPTS